jgi:nitrite reductase/ring-hydroxylating ferredoxin subunit
LRVKERNMLENFTRVGQTDELSPGQMKLVEIGEERILLTNVDGEYHAVSEVCTHVGGPLSEGTLEGPVVECPLHGSQFDVRTGAVENPPASMPLKVYRVRVQEQDILVGPP